MGQNDPFEPKELIKIMFSIIKCVDIYYATSFWKGKTKSKTKSKTYLVYLHIYIQIICVVKT